MHRAVADRHERAHTVLGRLSDILGVVFLVYCVYKLIMSSVRCARVDLREWTNARRRSTLCSIGILSRIPSRVG